MHVHVNIDMLSCENMMGAFVDNIPLAACNMRHFVFFICLDGQVASMLYCPHCFNLIRPDNHAVRLSPKSHAPQITKIKRQVTKYGFWSLSYQRKKYLKQWENSQTKLVSVVYTFTTAKRDK